MLKQSLKGKIAIIILLALGILNPLSAKEPAREALEAPSSIKVKLSVERGVLIIRILRGKKTERILRAIYPREDPIRDGQTELQKQARTYRNQGLRLQLAGNLDSAMTYYQKATLLDPSYYIAFNDLGIIYETKGFEERAKDSYLEAIRLNRSFLSPYSNLALLYENMGDYAKATYYWQQRLELNRAKDFWTQKAKRHIKGNAKKQ